MQLSVVAAVVSLIALIVSISVSASTTDAMHDAAKPAPNRITPPRSQGGSDAEDTEAPSVGPSGTKSVIIYAGTYTKSESWVEGTGQGIHSFHFDLETAHLTPLSISRTNVTGENPTFLTAVQDATRTLIYAVNEVRVPSTNTTRAKETGYVVAMEATGRGELKRLNLQEAQGAGSCHVSVDPTGRFAAVANYVGGNVALFPLTPSGALEAASDAHSYQGGSMVDPDRQEAPHLHSTTWVPDEPIAFAADLGNDRIAQFKLDSTAHKLKANTDTPFVATAPGAGPRHTAFHPSKSVAYVVNELASTIDVFSFELEKGVLSQKPTQTISTLPSGSTARKNTAAEVQVTKDGKYVYVSNRGDDSIAVYQVIDASSGALTLIQHTDTMGKTPRHFALVDRFLLVANQVSNDIQVFERDATTGKLTHSGVSTRCPSCSSLVVASK